MPDIFVAPVKSPATKTNALPNESVSPVATNPTPTPTIPLTNIKVRKGIHLFSAIDKNPTDMYFQNQGENETVLLFVRKAFITNFSWVAISIILLCLPIFIKPLFSLISLDLSFLPIRFFLFFSLLYYLLIMVYIYVSYITWYFKISLVTNDRVVEVDFSNLVFKNVSATKIDLVQDVSYSQIGVLRTLFDYGDVLVQTAGTIDNFTFEAVPQPENVVQLIENLIGKDPHV